MRSVHDQRRFETLRQHVKEHGMLNPLITYQGHVLIGMRRFEILQDQMESFECLEVTENINNWTSMDITRFQNWKTETYGSEVPAC